jgi:hypothetical protein
MQFRGTKRVEQVLHAYAAVTQRYAQRSRRWGSRRGASLTACGGAHRLQSPPMPRQDNGGSAREHRRRDRGGCFHDCPNRATCWTRRVARLNRDVAPPGGKPRWTRSRSASARVPEVRRPSRSVQVVSISSGDRHERGVKQSLGTMPADNQWLPYVSEESWRDDVWVAGFPASGNPATGVRRRSQSWSTGLRC